MDEESLAHTKYHCNYHIVFAPKYRRLVIYGRLKVEIGKILRELCKRKERFDPFTGEPVNDGKKK